jgi:hypothetical protein
MYLGVVVSTLIILFFEMLKISTIFLFTKKNYFCEGKKRIYFDTRALPIEKFKVMEKEIDIFGNLLMTINLAMGWENKLRNFIFLMCLKNNYIFAYIAL